MLVDTLSYIMERSQDFTLALQQHLYLTFVALSISVALGLTLGIAGTRIRRLRNLILTVGDLGRTIPSLAVLALAIPFLGIGTPPAILALVFIGTLPVMINTVIGIEQVDDAVTEAARGMGMNDRQVLAQVELPLATAVIMAGVRTAAVVVVASATLAAFIGGGGLGDLILRGHALRENHIMLAGALPATLLAFYFEEMFGRLEKVMTPRGLTVGIHERQEAGGSIPAVIGAILVMPLIFGLLLPWETFIDQSGRPVILTGLHPEYRAIAVPALLLGLLAALWPRESGSPQFRALGRWATAGAAILALGWLAAGLLRSFSALLPGHSVQLGVPLQLGAILALAAVTLIDLFIYWNNRKQDEVEPVATAESAI